MTSRSLKSLSTWMDNNYVQDLKHKCQQPTYFKTGFSSIALYFLLVDDNLNYPIPHFFTDIISSQSDEIQDGVHIPSIILSILLS